MNTEPIMDVTTQARTLMGEQVVKAEQKGTNVLMLLKLAGPNNVTLDRTQRRCRFQLHHRWLSDPASLTSVRGAENTYWGRREVAKCLRKHVQLKLFDMFQLF